MPARIESVERRDQGRPQALCDRARAHRVTPGVSSPRALRPGADAPPVRFSSILGEGSEEVAESPAFFTDLNLDQIVEAITAGREEYDLRPYLHAPLHHVDAVTYRHEVFRDLESKSLLEQVVRFARGMRQAREKMATSHKLYYRYEKERLLLDAVSTYCEAIARLERDLAAADLRSRGFTGFREFLADYTSSGRFTSLQEEAKRLYDDLSRVRYCVHIKDDRIRVRKAEAEIDYGAEVEKTFEKFKRGSVKSYLVEFANPLGLNHIEAAVLEMVAKLYPHEFCALNDFCARNEDYVDPRIAAFDREVQLYVGYLEYIQVFKRAGLSFCYPAVSSTDKAVHSVDGFDLALARKLLAENSAIVRNDFHLKGPERIFVVTGPNQGGKTTFARTFGQLHYLASIGCPVPGRDARLFLFDQLFTHFEREESIQTLRGKLEDDLIRIHDVLEQATSSSLLIMNEIFTSTTLHDALFLGRKVMGRIIRLGLLGVCVTFVDELACLGEETVSMVSTVDPENPALRTFKIVRRPADGLAHAMTIARKYRLTYGDLKRRIAS